MLNYHHIDCTHPWFMNNESKVKEKLRNIQLHIASIKCYYTHNNKVRDWHNHCTLFHLSKICYCKLCNCSDLFISIHHILVVCIDDMYCPLCSDKIQLCIEYKIFESYNKYTLTMKIRKICKCYQYADNNQLHIGNIECCWDNVNNLVSYQSRSNILKCLYQGNNCLDIRCKLTKSYKVDILEC